MGENILWFMIGLASVVFPLALILVTVNRKPKARLHFIVSLSNHIKIYVTMVKMKNIQFVEGVIAATDAQGDAAPIDKITEAKTDNENVATIEVVPSEEEGGQPTVKVIGHHAGATVGRIKVDVRLGDEVKEVEHEFAIEIDPSEATGFGINFGEPKDQPQAGE